MKPLPHQTKVAAEATKTLKQLGYVYINGQPRSGKTLTSILIAEQCNLITGRCMVLTKKAAIPGWEKFITPELKYKYTIINYEQLATTTGKLQLKHNPADYSLVIIDESHNFGSFPKMSRRIQALKLFCRNLPHIHLSGTPVIESAMAIYHQMAISIYTPFKHLNFYKFFNEFGIPSTEYIRGQAIPKYNLFKDELLSEIQKFTHYMSQQMAGIDIEVEDVIHYVELAPEIKKLYNKLLKDRVAELLTETIVCDTTMALRTTLHQVEGGIVKVGDRTIPLGITTDKIEYIRKHFGDNEDVGIMAHFIGERELLSQYFKKAKIFSSNAHAEGVDLSYLKHFIVYSSDYSGAKHVQRRERIANINGSNTNKVHFLLVKKGISEQVYKTLSAKRDFNNDTFYEEEI